MDRAGTSLEQYQRAGQPLTSAGGWMDLGHIPDLSPSRGRTLPPTRIFKHDIAPCSAAVSLTYAGEEILWTKLPSELIAASSADILLPPNTAKKIKSPIGNYSILNVGFRQRMCELTEGTIFFRKRFLLLFPNQPFTRVEDSEWGERMAAGGCCKTPRINIPEQKQACD